MFYPGKISNIKNSDRVLEVGPGSDPFGRSDILLEIDLGDEELSAQRGHTPIKNHGKKVVYYDGGKFPFEDKEFDYVIASHVLEHVPDPKKFVSELVRVSNAGYIEFPTALYEHLYNFDVHLNLLNFHDGAIYYMKKSKLPYGAFAPVHSYFRKSLDSGYSQLVDTLQKDMFVGLEWMDKINIKEAESLADLVPQWDNPRYGHETAPRPLQKKIVDKIRKVFT
jgi:SAM-dependent methyltransferase